MTDTEQPTNSLPDPSNESSGTDNINLLKSLCSSNAELFAKDNTEHGQRLYISLMAIIDTLNILYPKVIDIEKRAHEFDFDENTPGNGYRSFVIIFNKTVNYTIDINEKFEWKSNRILYRKTELAKELECCSHLLASIDTCFKHLQTMIGWTNDGNVLSGERSAQELMSVCEDINQYCFYGRFLGSQFCDSLKNVLQFINITMAILSEAYYNEGSFLSKAASSLFSTSKYINDPELRAKRVVNISRNADVDFCKSFWTLSEAELLNRLPSVVTPSVAVCKVITISPEPLLIKFGDKEITVPVPTCYIGPQTISIRLISSQLREGMLGTRNRNKLQPPARGLIIHCHGGGFVAQSSKSHEGYLRDWAKQIDVPIVSIDYSLAPKAPFPRAHEEVFYVYCWILKNYKLLGSSGEKILTVGDSAGANLLLSCALKCIHMDVPLPNGIFLAYVPTLIKFVPSPSRLLCMMDPLLPIGFLLRCLKAYACPEEKTDCPQINNTENSNSDTDCFEEISESDLSDLEAHKSPVSDASDTLTYGSLTSNNDNNAIEKDLTTAEIEQSEKFVADIVQKCVLGRDYLGSMFTTKYYNNSTTNMTNERESDIETDESKTLVMDEEPSTSTSENSFKNKLYGLFTNIKGHFNKVLHELEEEEKKKKKLWDPVCRKLDINDDNMKELWSEICSYEYTDNPYLSPICATDEDLKKLPPVKILTVELDPCLDDCVMFAKRLKSLGNDIQLDILKDLPHGFLNFSLLSKDAHEGSKLCTKRMKELLNLEENE